MTIVAIDAGTTGVRAVAVDDRGVLGPYAYAEFPQHFPRPGWVEHDPDEIWDTTCRVLAELVARIEGPIAAIGITDQRETTVVWDARTGEPRHNAIVWQDRRTTDMCRRLEDEGHLPLIRATTGLVLDPYFSATKLHWLLTEGGVAPDGDLRFGTVDAWLIHQLSRHRVHVTDVTNASRTLLYDIGAGRWSPELLELFDVPATCLPEVRPSSTRLTVTGDDLPVPAGIPVSGVAGDQQAALFGQACFAPGMAKNTYGTGSFLLMNAGIEVPAPVEGLLGTIAWQLGETAPVYALEGASFSTGATIQWLRDGLGLISEAAEIGPLAASVPDAGGVYVVPAFTGLGSPWWDPRARGTIVGITRGTGRGELARAVVESIAFQCADIADAMISAADRPLGELRVDGGASVMDLLLQFQADLIDAPVLRSADAETTALGAAFLAGLAEGVWASTEEIAGLWRSEARFDPAGDPDELAARRARWHDAVARARDWA